MSDDNLCYQHLITGFIQLVCFCYSKLLKTNFQLTAAIMEALDSLSLDSTLRTEVCQLMLQTLNKAPPEFLPAIVGFLISSDEPIENLVEVGYNFGSCYYIIKCSCVCAYILYQHTVKAGTGWSWLRIGTGGGHLWVR